MYVQSAGSMRLFVILNAEELVLGTSSSSCILSEMMPIAVYK